VTVVIDGSVNLVYENFLALDARIWAYFWSDFDGLGNCVEIYLTFQN